MVCCIYNSDIVNKNPKTTTITAIDIGTYKICTSVINFASNEGSDAIKIVNSCCRRTNGIRGGSIINLVSLTRSILETIIEVERQSQYQVKDVYISIPSQFTITKRKTKTFIFSGDIISEKYIQDFLSSAKKSSSSDLDVLHVFVIQYLIDDRLEVQNPVGMSVNKLKITVNIVYGVTSFTKAVRRELKKQNINILSFVLSQYSASLSTISKEEKQEGATIIDIGYESTTILCISEDNIQEIHSVDAGGNQITKNIASSLNMISEGDAEIIKTTRAHATTERYIYNMFANQDDLVQYKTIDKNNNIYVETVSIKKINSIVSGSIDNLFTKISSALNDVKCRKALQRIIITGGGSKINGLHEFITSRRIFQGSIFRIGNPININGTTSSDIKTSSFASSAGLAIYAKHNKIDNQDESQGFIAFLKNIFGSN